MDLATGRVYIPSHNHGFAVDEKTLPANLRATHVSLFDDSNCGIELTDRPAFTHRSQRRGVIGPFGARQLALAAGSVVIAAVVLVTRPSLGEVVRLRERSAADMTRELEALTTVLLAINKRYKTRAGTKISGLPPAG